MKLLILLNPVDRLRLFVTNSAANARLTRDRTLIHHILVRPYIRVLTRRMTANTLSLVGQIDLFVGKLRDQVNLV